MTGCQQYSKSTKRNAFEGQVRELMLALQPSQSLIAPGTGMFREAWDARSAELRHVATKKIQTVDKEIETHPDRIVRRCHERAADLMLRGLYR